MGIKDEQRLKEEKEAENKRRLDEASKRFDNGEVDEEDQPAIEDEPKPTGIVQPKYKIVHSYNVEIEDTWAGYTTSEMDHEKMMKSKIPTHLTVTINLKWAESMKAAKLDINEETLLFEYPGLYYLDLNLKYKCNPDAGSAKFDKTKKTLTIKLPIVGLTKDS